MNLSEKIGCLRKCVEVSVIGFHKFKAYFIITCSRHCTGIFSQVEIFSIRASLSNEKIGAILYEIEFDRNNIISGT